MSYYPPIPGGAIGEPTDAEHRTSALEAVALGLVAQAEEFTSWDYKDWPAAREAIRRLASEARAALGSREAP